MIALLQHAGRRLRERRGRFLAVFAVFILFATSALGLVTLGVDIDTRVVLREPVLAGLVEGRLPPAATSGDFLLLLAVGIVLSIGLPVLPPLFASLLTLLAGLAVFGHAFVDLNLPMVPLEYQFTMILVLFITHILIGYFAEVRTRQHLLGLFGQYVEPSVVAQLAGSRSLPSLRGEAREVTVLFADIKGFTSMAENLDPREVASFLNDYLTVMTEVLHRHGATIDKYIGDAVMAFWGAPLEQPDHARRGVAAGLDMLDAVERLRPGFAGRGWPDIDIGIGISSGSANVGNMGSRFRVAYTVIGDTVNLASRLEQLTRNYGNSLIVSEETRRMAESFQYRELDRVRVKGREQSTLIFEPLQANAAKPGEAESRHDEALHAYYAGDTRTAIKAWAALADAFPQDRYFRVMLERARGSLSTNR